MGIISFTSDLEFMRGAAKRTLINDKTFFKRTCKKFLNSFFNIKEMFFIKEFFDFMKQIWYINVREYVS